MRLTKLKLAGFKSFVDPQTVMLPGQLVGVVGPNGCGKSNIIDAVRWVLGESKAGALRGESMQDVIFAGSATRKPVGRASVEMVFDNSLGRIAGQWSQYAELAVKRVMERDGQSDYYINSQRVRRKDIIDLFLGTGLGPRAYAIIEQGMISRIIEAKPEELRLFLEEAAGVSKYKERRKETQGRLEDARENLARVEDIRNELGQQIIKLEGQAEIAAQYQALVERLAQRQALLWLLKRNDAQADRERFTRQVEKLTLDIEQQTATLREAEAALEATRSEHFSASDTVHAAQGEMYAANSEVSRLETDLRRSVEMRQRLDAQITQLTAEEENWRQRREMLQGDLERWQELSGNAEERVAQAEARHEQAAQHLPEAEEHFRQAEEQASLVRRELTQAEQQMRVEEAHRNNAQRALEAAATRRARVEEERAQLEAPDLAELDAMQLRVESLSEAQEVRNAAVADCQQRIPMLQEQGRAAQEASRTAHQRLTEARARHQALLQLQERTQSQGKLADWLSQVGLRDAVPLWKAIDVQPGWETALEAVLRERLSALAGDAEALKRALTQAAPESVVVARLQSSNAGAEYTANDTLAKRITVRDARWQGVMAGWLKGWRVVDELNAEMIAQVQLQAGEAIVDKAGRVLTPEALVLFAPDARTHGVLERQRELEEIASHLHEQEAHCLTLTEQVQAGELALGEAQETLVQLRRDAQDITQQVHAAQLDLLKLTQTKQRYDERVNLLQRDLDEVERTERVEREHLERAAAEGARATELLELMRDKLTAALDAQREADGQLREARHQEQSAARTLQEAKFSGRECESRLTDIRANLEIALRESARAADDLTARRGERAGIDESVIDEQLQGALAIRREKEQALAVCRDALEAVAARLKGLDEQRLRAEQAVAPMREKINELRLKEQAAQLAEEQFASRLAEASADIEALLPQLTPQLRESTLNGEIAQINQQITDLGPVNLAALQELQASSERKNYLDEQSADLIEAIGTLEDAIRRIDRETRAQLQETYDKVNSEFGRLFPELFGGGEAKLVMTGEEILDCGLQVMAHPPGKKNSSIHLLSGGEKALTAIALVFAIFQLNPAPFCLLDEVDAPLDDSNTERFCEMVKRMSEQTQFLYISHNKITMEMAQQLIGVTMQEKGVSRVVEVDVEQAVKLASDQVAVAA